MSDSIDRDIVENVSIHRFKLDELERMRELGIIDSTAPISIATGLRRFTLAEYHTLIENSILTSGDNIELLNGYLVKRDPSSPTHDGTLDLIRAAITPVIPKSMILRSRQVITLTDSEPEPDFAIVRGNPRSFSKQHPSQKQTFAVFEVSDKSLDLDRKLKLKIYAQHSIPEYWIFNLVDSRIELYSNPIRDKISRYAKCSYYSSEQTIPLLINGRKVAQLPVNSILPY